MATDYHADLLLALPHWGRRCLVWYIPDYMVNPVGYFAPCCATQLINT